MKVKVKKIICDANEAVARIAHKTNEICAIYPITPASPMGEHAEMFSAVGNTNIWDNIPKIIEMQSEGGASGTIHGALQAGALTKALDRDLPSDHPDQVDFSRAEDFRLLAEELDIDPAVLAHQYALSIPHVDSVVLGVKNRAELKQCLAAEKNSPLDSELIKQIDACVP